jgi:hypothetical protein
MCCRWMWGILVGGEGVLRSASPSAGVPQLLLILSGRGAGGMGCGVIRKEKFERAVLNPSRDMICAI